MRYKQVEIQKIPVATVDELSVFTDLRMSDAEVAIYLKLYCHLPAASTIPEFISEAIVWSEPEVAASFRDYFRTETSFAEEQSCLYSNNLPEQYKSYTLGEKSRRAWLMLTRMHRRDLKVEIDNFLCLHPARQISLMELITGIPDIDQNIEYKFLLQCIDNLHNFEKTVNVDSNEAWLNTGIVSKILNLKKFRADFKTSEVLQKLRGLGLNLTSSFNWLNQATDSAVMTDMLLSDAFKTVTQLEYAHSVQINAVKQRLY